MEDPKKQNPKTHAPRRAEQASKPSPQQEEKVEEVVVAENEQIEKLKSELEKVEHESRTNLDGWQRERAEFANYKKRIDREHAHLKSTITGDIIKKYLVIMDDIELALKNKPTDGTGAAWAEGIELISRKLNSIIESEGIERINSNHVPFDPNIHEAISHEECPGFESGEVIEVFRQGYKLGDRILRPAMVRVAR